MEQNKTGITIHEVVANEKPKKDEIKYEEIPCNNCQGGGCPTCNGYGFYYGAIIPNTQK